jgi:hypothetical protein
MECYITRDQAKETCKKLRNFYLGLKDYYFKSGLDIESNRGRRNILMSEPMEIFLAQELLRIFHKVESDGRTGKADICITHKDGTSIELECKLTSPHLSSGSVAFQTDYETLEKKGKLDYVYIVADETFEKFCFIYFKDLDLTDFRGLSPGARGKVQMYKHRGMKKATVLLGNVIDLKENMINKLEIELDDLMTEAREKLASMTEKIESLNETQNYDRSKLLSSYTYNKQMYAKRINKLNEKIIMKRTKTNSSYSFQYGDIS